MATGSGSPPARSSVSSPTNDSTRSRSEVRAVVGSDLALVDHLHSAGWPVTWSCAGGPDGTVTMLFVALDDRRASHVVAELRQLRPEAFVTVHRLGTVHAAAPAPLTRRRRTADPVPVDAASARTT